jgi:hypothetical protein
MEESPKKVRESPKRNHNKGPIGPLDPDEPPPWEPDLRRDQYLDGLTLIEVLRSMGVDIDKRELEYLFAKGLPCMERPGKKLYQLGPVLDFLACTPPISRLTRKEAVEYLHSIGCPMSDTTLQQLPRQPKVEEGEEDPLRYGPPYEIERRNAYYRKEDLDKWWKERKATWPTRSFAPKYRPLNSRRQCPSWHKGCPNVPHERCKKFPRALCNVQHLPVRPGPPRKHGYIHRLEREAEEIRQKFAKEAEGKRNQ